MVSKQEIDNSLEASRYTYGFLTPHEASTYVWSKSILGTTIPNQQEIIDFLNNTQDADGGWSASQGTGLHGRYFDTGRVLTAYYLMNTTPALALDVFLKTVDTWDEVHAWGEDWRDIYHPFLCWMLGKWKYPPWKDEFFTAVEAKQADLLDWTTNTSGYQGGHRRTHILYSYVFARRQFPNLNGIIDAILAMQRADGSFPGLSELPSHYPLASYTYDTSIEISLINQILKLYPGIRSQELTDSLSRTVPYIQSQYQTQVHPTLGTTCGFFTPSWDSIEWSVLIPLMACAGNGLMALNLDVTFQNIIDRLQGGPTPPKLNISNSPELNVPVYLDDGLGGALVFIGNTPITGYAVVAGRTYRVQVEPEVTR